MVRQPRRMESHVCRRSFGVHVYDGKTVTLERKMRIRKAVITAAGKAQRALPLQTLIDSDGEEKSVLQILVEQALDAGVEEVGIVVWPGDESRYSESVAASVRGRLHFVPQPQPLGYAHALYC